MPDLNNPTTPGGEQGNEAANLQGKKIAGKFNSIEEAVEQGYTGLEKKVHELSETTSKVVKLLETALSSPNDPVPIGGRGREDAYNRGRPAADDVDPVEFLKAPGEFLKKRDEKIVRDIQGVVVDLVGNMLAVSEFKAQNQDLHKHEKLVSAFMKDQPQNLSTAEKLQNAGKAAREYLKSLKVDLNAGNPNPAPKGNDFNEPPTNAGPARLPIPNTDDEGENELVTYINERNQEMAAHFGGPTKK